MHENKIISKICFENNCDKELLCEDCVKDHPFGHVVKTTDIEQLLNKESYKKKLEIKTKELKTNTKNEIKEQIQKLKNESLEEINNEFKKYDKKFEEMFEENKNKFLISKYNHFVEIFKENKSKTDLILLAQKYNQYINLQFEESK